MDELSSLKKGDDVNSIKLASLVEIIRDELAKLGNPSDDNTLALRVWSWIPSEYGTLSTVLLNKEDKLVMSEVTAKLMQVEKRNMAGSSSKSAGGVRWHAFTVAAPKMPFDKSLEVCYYCDGKVHMNSDCYKQKVDET